MAEIFIEGGAPLVGNVTVSGSKYSALNLICASVFTNEDVILDNVPKTGIVGECLAVFQSLGGHFEWIGNNKLLLNSSKIDKFEITKEVGGDCGSSLLFAGPLLYRFGRANLPKVNIRLLPSILFAWKSLGVNVEEYKDTYYLSLVGETAVSNINFKAPSHLGTISAIFVALFRCQSLTISNASEQSELDDLLEFCAEMGVDIERIEPKKIRVKLSTLFRGVRMEIQPDKDEAVAFAIAALLTHGNVVIGKVNRTVMIPFVNLLNKLGARFEFDDGYLKVWRNEEQLVPLHLTIAPTPGITPHWHPLICLLLSQVQGESSILDGVNITGFNYTKDLNRMGAKIDVTKPSTKNIAVNITDERYNLATSEEPEIFAKITGFTKLRANRLHLSDFKGGPVLVVAALCADGRSEITDPEVIDYYMEQFFDKLKSLGAKVWKRQA